MIYADTDFIFALLKDSDWLKQSSREVYEERKDEIYTSHVTINELLILCERENLDPKEKLGTLEMMIEVKADMNKYLEAAHYMKEHGLHTFDALQVAFSNENKILTTDQEIKEITEVEDFK
ncbi:MAG: type II toxin-antitoxin system VapC family toxin [Candidatus Nanohalobium sp.]